MERLTRVGWGGLWVVLGATCLLMVRCARNATSWEDAPESGGGPSGGVSGTSGGASAIGGWGGEAPEPSSGGSNPAASAGAGPSLDSTGSGDSPNGGSTATGGWTASGDSTAVGGSTAMGGSTAIGGWLSGGSGGARESGGSSTTGSGGALGGAPSGTGTSSYVDSVTTACVAACEQEQATAKYEDPNGSGLLSCASYFYGSCSTVSCGYNQPRVWMWLRVQCGSEKLVASLECLSRNPWTCEVLEDGRWRSVPPPECPLPGDGCTDL
jgi:hypothetical protein